MQFSYGYVHPGGASLVVEDGGAEEDDTRILLDVFLQEDAECIVEQRRMDARQVPR